MKVDDFKEKLLKSLQTPLIATILVILLALGLLNTIWHNVVNIRAPQSIGSGNTFRPQPKIKLQELQNYHLLGTFSTNLKDLPLASLGVTLVGIFSDNQGNSTALITLRGGNSNIYHIGDTLTANVRIVKILSHSIVVKHNGRLERLEMPIQPVEFKSSLPESGLWYNAT